MSLYQSQEGVEGPAKGAETPKPKTEQPVSLVSEIWDWVKSISIALVVVIVLNLYVFNLSTVKGHSMEPTLKEKEWLFVNKLVYKAGHPKRGDVVILKDPELTGLDRQFLVKRVVALPGDKVEIRTGKLYVNGGAIEEPYTDNRIEDGDRGPFVVEAGHYFVMGDNRHQGASKDSRIFGSVKAEMIQGRADFILWPFGQAGTL